MTDDRRLAAIAALADALIPPSAGYLSGSQAGVPGACLDAAATARPDLIPVLDEAAAAVANGTPAAEVVATWSAQRPESFDLLFLLIRGAYFLNRNVCEQLHYDGATPRPLSDAVEPDYLDLVAAVIARGPEYRNACPHQSGARLNVGDSV
ncbi:MAG: hypothetical protein EPN48_01565 [Microbacteriaceae bacterium]|nr:MAG: hypothetical protein EPN48_01565 [Microbacteriaceae bacterium]